MEIGEPPPETVIVSSNGVICNQDVLAVVDVGTSCAVTSQRNVCSRDLREIWSSELRSVLAIPDRSWPPNSIFLSDLYGRDVSLQCRGQYCEK